MKFPQKQMSKVSKLFYKLRVSFSSGSFGSGGGATVVMGGSRRIFLPCLPSFRFHRPDRGRLPNSRMRCALPTCSLLCSTFDKRPTVAMQVRSKANSRLEGNCTTTLSSNLRRMVPKVPAAWIKWQGWPGFFSRQ